MSYDLPQRLTQIADADTVTAETNAFLAAVSIDEANYDLMRHGDAKPIDLVRGSISSYYFQRIESLLQPEQIQTLNKKALAIIDTLRQDVASPAGSV
jgi:hypothetical protein